MSVERRIRKNKGSLQERHGVVLEYLRVLGPILVGVAALLAIIMR